MIFSKQQYSFVKRFLISSEDTAYAVPDFTRDLYSEVSYPVITEQERHNKRFNLFHMVVSAFHMSVITNTVCENGTKHTRIDIFCWNGLYSFVFDRSNFDLWIYTK